MLRLNFKNLHKHLFVLLFTVVVSKAFTQDLKFKHLSSEQGLSQVSVQAIIEDSDGFMWFATQDGLNRYDGFHFKVFKNNPLDKKSISSNAIYCMYEDVDSLIYIGTKETGMSVYDRYTETFINYKPSMKKTDLPSPAIRSICAANKNELLIGTEDGLCIYNKQTKIFKTINLKGTDKSFYVTKVFKTTNGKLLVAAPRFGIYELNLQTKELMPFYVPDELNNPKIDFYKIALTNIEQKEDKLLIGSFSGGIYIIDSSNGILNNHIDFKDENLNKIKDFKSQPKSNLIIVITTGGYIELNVKTLAYKVNLSNALDNSSIISNDLLSCCISKNNTIWVGTYANGVELNLSNFQKFQHLKIGSLKEENRINCFLETKNQAIFIGNDIGLYIFDKIKNKVSHLIELDHKKQITVQCLAEDLNGNIWVGSALQGLYLYNLNTKKTIKVLDSEFSNIHVLKIICDTRGTMWLGTFNEGLYSINPNTLDFKNYNKSEGLASNKVNNVFFDEENNHIVLSTGDVGFSILDFITNTNKPFVRNYKHSDSKNSISSDVVYQITKDKNSIYWIATNNGLNSFNGKTKEFKSYTELDGLCNNTIWSLTKDKDENLWLPTTNGLSFFNTQTKQFKNYYKTNGLQDNEFSQGASYVCHDGSILVGGINGFNYFNPKNIKDDTLTPQTFIYSFSRQGKDIQTDTSLYYKKYIELPYNQNYFSFEFIAQNYASPDKTKFMYILEGKDLNWSAPTDVRYVSYTSLEGGTYTFKVKACNSDGVWRKTPYQITIKIIPPWYKTIWFYTLFSISVLGFIYGFIAFRTNAVKKENKKLESKVEERTQELAEKNRDITSSIEYAKRIQEAILPAKSLIFSRFKNAFILYQPKDIVSGDFYWFDERHHYKIIATVDCTGHGVPGAFMSMIGHNLLNQIVAEKNTFDPGLILQELHKGIQAALKQGSNTINTNDGMDVSMIAINTETRSCFWAGAYRSLVIINSDGEVEKIDGNKYPVGGAQLDSHRVFTTHVRTLSENDSLYMFTDGYADQFGGEKGKKFMVKRFHDNLLNLQHLPMSQQKEELLQQFNNWKGGFEQVDDVLVIGIRV